MEYGQSRAHFACTDCGLQLNQFILGINECPKCGSVMRIMHPLTVTGQTYSEYAIMTEFDKGMEAIEKRLAAESRLDEYS